jgi:hypothetical protein
MSLNFCELQNIEAQISDSLCDQASSREQFYIWGDVYVSCTSRTASSQGLLVAIPQTDLDLTVILPINRMLCAKAHLNCQ